MTERCDCDDTSCLGDLLGRPSWPVAAIVIAIATYFAITDWQEKAAESDLKTQIVRECAGEENVQRCADQLKEAVD